MDEILKFLRIADEENRRVVTDQIVVALLGVELEREAAGIADRVGRSGFLGDRGKPRQHGRAQAFFAQKISFAPGRHVFGNLEKAVSAAALGVNHAFRNPFAVELRHLLDQVMVLQQDRTVGAGGKGMFVARSRNACIGGRYRRCLICHDQPLYWLACFANPSSTSLATRSRPAQCREYFSCYRRNDPFGSSVSSARYGCRCWADALSPWATPTGARR